MNDISIGSYNSSPSVTSDSHNDLWISWVSHDWKRDERYTPYGFSSHVFVRSRDVFPNNTIRVSTGSPSANPCVVAADKGVIAFWTEFEKGRCRLMMSDLRQNHTAGAVALTETGIESRVRAVAYNGGVHLVWQQLENKRSVIKKAKLRGKKLVSIATLSDPRFDGFSPEICSGNSCLAVAWVCRCHGQFVVQGVIDNGHRQAWHLDTTADTHNPTLVWDANRGIFWMACRGVSEKTDLLVTGLKPENGEILQPDVRQSGTLATNPKVGHQVLVMPDGSPWIVWCDFQNYKHSEIWARPLLDKSWGKPVRLVEAVPTLCKFNVSTCSKQFSATIDGNGNPWLAWIDWEILTGPALLKIKQLHAIQSRGAQPGLTAFRGCASTGKPAKQEAGLPRYRTVGGNKKMAVYFGDMHGHGIHSYDGSGAPYEYFAYARDQQRMDFCFLTDHDPTMEEYCVNRHYARMFSRDSGFLALVGYEDCFAAPALGDKVIYIFDEKVEPLWGLLHIGERMLDRDYYQQHFNGKKVIIISHDASFGAPGICEDDVWIERLSPVVQLSTTHARDYHQEFECFRKGFNKRPQKYVRYHDLLRKGFRPGVVGASDTHFECPQIRTALYLPSLSPAAVYQALLHKRCYALTGEKINLDVRVDRHFMGMTVKHSGDRHQIAVRAQAATDIDKAEIVCNCRTVGTLPGNGVLLRQNFRHQAKGPCFYYVRVFLKNGNMAWSSPVWFV